MYPAQPSCSTAAAQGSGDAPSDVAVELAPTGQVLVQGQSWRLLLRLATQPPSQRPSVRSRHAVTAPRAWLAWYASNTRSAGADSDFARRADLCDSLWPLLPFVLCFGVVPIAPDSSVCCNRPREECDDVIFRRDVASQAPKNVLQRTRPLQHLRSPSPMPQHIACVGFRHGCRYATAHVLATRWHCVFPRHIRRTFTCTYGQAQQTAMWGHGGVLHANRARNQACVASFPWCGMLLSQLPASIRLMRIAACERVSGQLRCHCVSDGSVAQPCRQMLNALPASLCPCSLELAPCGPRLCVLQHTECC